MSYSSPAGAHVCLDGTECGESRRLEKLIG